MFDAISGTQQAMLWLAVIMCGGFTAFTLFAIVPMVRTLREQTDFMRRQTDTLLRLIEAEIFSPKSIKSTISADFERTKNHAASGSPDANRPLPGRDG